MKLVKTKAEKGVPKSVPCIKVELAPNERRDLRKNSFCVGSRGTDIVTITAYKSSDMRNERLARFPVYSVIGKGSDRSFEIFVPVSKLDSLAFVAYEDGALEAAYRRT